MHTLVPHLLVATTLAAYRLKDFPAASQSAAGAASSMTGVTAVLIIVIIIVIGAMVSALRTTGALLAELLRATIKITSALVTIVAVIALVLLVLVHH